MLSVIGEALIDLVAGDDRTSFVAHPGGSPLNVAIGAARLGEQVEFLARIADDAFGRLLREYATGNGVGLDHSPSAAEPSTLAVVSVAPDGAAAYDFYVRGTADWQWTDAELVIPDGTQVLHFGSLTSWTPPGAAIVLEAVRAARESMLISYDPNVRPRLIGDLPRGRDAAIAAVSAAHLVKASDEDIAWLYPRRAHEEVAREWLDSGPTLVIITGGSQGATAYRTDHRPIHLPAVEIEVVDTVGAGDSCMGALISGLMRSGVRTGQDLEQLEDAAINTLLEDALLVASITCSRAGANPPTRAELDAARG